jgi:hypothetical protein
MTVLKTAYDTTACKDYLMKKTEEAIDQAHINGQLRLVEGTSGIYEVQGGASVSDAVPAFAHPIGMQDGQDHVKIVIDVRSFGKFDLHQGTFHVRNLIDYKFAQLRAKLNYVFLDNAPTILRDISPMPMAVFATWVSEAIARRFALDPQEQLNLAILSAIWYNSQFVTETAFSEREKMALATALQRSMRVSPEVTMEMLDTVPVVVSIGHFCELARQVTQSVRLDELNTGLMYAILGSSFARSDWREMVAVALEHPPTWIALCALAVTERTYKHTVVTKITERSSFRNEGQTFVRAVTKMADTLTVR